MVKNGLNNLADDKLVSMCRDGDDHAFEILVIRYQERIHRILFRFVRDEELSKDLTQETFIKIYNSIRNFEGRSSFYTWLYRITVNTALDYMGTSKYNIGKRSIPIDYVHARTSRNSPEKELLSKELMTEIIKAIDALPHELKVSITLREFEGFSYNEIAEVEGCPIGTVRSRLFRAREELAKKLSHHEKK